MIPNESNASDKSSVLVIGAGPAGLRAAEVVADAGLRVTTFEGQASPGRKFLVAGRGGLNLTHGEPIEKFPVRYGSEEERWRDLLGKFGPRELRTWAANLGYETYVGTSGRVFPRGQKSAGLLRAWLRSLRARGVTFRANARLVRLKRVTGRWRAAFSTKNGSYETEAYAIILALGGASWPQTGSDGTWPGLLADFGVEVAPWQAANCGWEVAWPKELLAVAEGMPLKNLHVSANGKSFAGELLITRYGLEGGAIYRLGPVLRSMATPSITIDFKPQLSLETLRRRLHSLGSSRDWYRALKLGRAVTALLKAYASTDCYSREGLTHRIKNFELALQKPRSLAEAISSAGGIRWSELDRNLMLTKMPGVFAAGEMIDWEAPTGGYLLQGCFATGTRAGRGAVEFVRNSAAGRE